MAIIFQLAQRPTPIHAWNLPGVPDGYHVSIKRDDMTGSTLSGNKVYIVTDEVCSEHVITVIGSKVRVPTS